MTASPEDPASDPAQTHLETAEKLRSGEYFREARAMYDFTVHDVMAERYMYLFVTFVSLLILCIAQLAAGGLYPLNKPVPLIVSTANPYEDIPRLRNILAEHNENPSEALLRFMGRQYAITREEYNIDSFDRNVNAVRSQSSPEVFAAFQEQVDPRNPDSPITLYQRHSVRKIAIVSSKRESGGMEVIFDATVEGNNAIKKSRWRANIAFEYSGIELDEKGDKVKPVQFIVTNYRVKRLQENQ